MRHLLIYTVSLSAFITSDFCLAGSCAIITAAIISAQPVSSHPFMVSFKKKNPDTAPNSDSVLSIIDAAVGFAYF